LNELLIIFSLDDKYLLYYHIMFSNRAENLAPHIELRTTLLQRRPSNNATYRCNLVHLPKALFNLAMAARKAWSPAPVGPSL